jgi:hypothetical protein
LNVEKFDRYKLGIRSLEDLINQLVPTNKNGIDLIRNAKNHVVYVFKCALLGKRIRIKRGKNWKGLNGKTHKRSEAICS